MIVPTCTTQPRSGLSLLEVLVALAIFLMSLTAIASLVDSSADRAIDLDVRSRAAEIAQMQLARVTAGDVPLNTQGDTSCEDDPDFNWSLTADQDTAPGLYKVTVKVNRTIKGKTIEVSLSQYVFDPTKRGSTDASTVGTDSTNPPTP